MLRIIILTITLALVSSSCATLFNDKRRSVVVTSSPAGASILVNGKPRGITPKRISVSDQESLTISMRLDGYHAGGCYINTSVEAVWLILDVVLIATVAPIVVDLITDNWSSLKSEFCSVNLLPLR